jgi:hypothetical protein
VKVRTALAICAAAIATFAASEATGMALPSRPARQPGDERSAGFPTIARHRVRPDDNFERRHAIEEDRRATATR